MIMNLKRIAVMLLALVMSLCMMLPMLHADVIFEPYNNSFYDDHRDEMEYINKIFIAHGTVYGYTSPESDHQELSASEGTQLWISHKYVDDNGTEWGVYDNNDGTSCWFQLSQLEPVYDHRDFVAEHEQELTEYAGELDELPIDGSEMILWSYPGSGEISGIVILNDYFAESAFSEFVYTDANGEKWIYYPYIRGMKGWAYAPDPLRTEPVLIESAAPAPTDTPAPTLTPAPLPSELPEESSEDVPVQTSFSRTTLLIIAIIAVFMVMLLSVVLIVVLYVLNKNKKKKS